MGSWPLKRKEMGSWLLLEDGASWRGTLNPVEGNPVEEIMLRSMLNQIDDVRRGSMCLRQERTSLQVKLDPPRYG